MGGAEVLVVQCGQGGLPKGFPGVLTLPSTGWQLGARQAVPWWAQPVRRETHG